MSRLINNAERINHLPISERPNDCTDFCQEDFGEKVFFTQEAAEAKLKELEGE